MTLVSDSGNSTAASSLCAYVGDFLKNSVSANRSGDHAFFAWQNHTHGQGLHPVIYLAIPKQLPSHLLPFNQSMSDAFWKVVGGINQQLLDAGVGLQYKPSDAQHPPDINVYAWNDIPGGFQGDEYPASIFYNPNSIFHSVGVVWHEFLHLFRGPHPQDSPEFQTAGPDALALLCNLQHHFSSLLYPESCPAFEGKPNIDEQFNSKVLVGVGDVGLIEYQLANGTNERLRVVAETCNAAKAELDLIRQNKEGPTSSRSTKMGPLLTQGSSWYQHPAALQAGASFAKAFVETLALNLMLDRLSQQGRFGLRRVLLPVASSVLEWSLLSRFQFDGKSLAIAALPRVFDTMLPTTLRTLAKPLGYLGYAKTLALFFDKQPGVALLSVAAGVGSTFAGRGLAEALTTLVLGKERSQAVRQTWEQGHPEGDVWHDAQDSFDQDVDIEQPIIEQAKVARAWQMVKHADQFMGHVLSNYFGGNALLRKCLPAPAAQVQEQATFQPANP